MTLLKKQQNDRKNATIKRLRREFEGERERADSVVNILRECATERDRFRDEIVTLNADIVYLNKASKEQIAAREVSVNLLNSVDAVRNKLLKELNDAIEKISKRDGEIRSLKELVQTLKAEKIRDRDKIQYQNGFIGRVGQQDENVIRLAEANAGGSNNGE